MTSACHVAPVGCEEVALKYILVLPCKVSIYALLKYFSVSPKVTPTWADEDGFIEEKDSLGRITMVDVNVEDNVYRRNYKKVIKLDLTERGD